MERSLKEGSLEEGERARPDAVIAAINATPYYRLLGMEVEAMRDGYARVTMPVEEKLFQMYGSVHGGAIASLADTAIGVALISVLSDDEKSITVDLKLNFVSAVSGGLLTAEARLFHRGKRTAAGEVEVRDGEGRLVAKGTSTLMPLRG